MSRRDNKKHTLLLFALAGGMFGFAFALVPLYDVICEVTGLNGKTSTQVALAEEIEGFAVPSDRSVTIEFLARAARGMPWEFRPLEQQMRVQPGTMNVAIFHARNRARIAVIGQAVPSVSPGRAARYLKKIECFCFEQQKLPAGGEMDMAVSFIIDPDLPADISKLTLSYTMFLVSDLAAGSDHAQMASHQE
ncbi:MAG: cytochrome c oxidase assembly protein [Proteobacteria bacterium]|nr:cytochrome c oxidase assembly protein [Pseudomonadota bacterium]